MPFRLCCSVCPGSTVSSCCWTDRCVYGTGCGHPTGLRSGSTTSILQLRVWLHFRVLLWCHYWTVLWCKHRGRWRLLLAHFSGHDFHLRIPTSSKKWNFRQQSRIPTNHNILHVFTFNWRARCKNGLSDDFGPTFTKPPNYLLSCNVTVAKWMVSCSLHIVFVIWIEFPPKLYQVTLLLARKVKLPKCHKIPIISAGGKKQFCCCPWWMWL